MATEIIGTVYEIGDTAVVIKDDDGQEIKIDFTHMESIRDQALSDIGKRISFVYNKQGCQWKHIDRNEKQEHLVHDLAKSRSNMLSGTACAWLMEQLAGLEE